MSNGKDMIIHSIVGLIKKISYNYATKADIKNITHVDISSFAVKTNLSSLKTKVDKIRYR